MRELKVGDRVRIVAQNVEAWKVFIGRIDIIKAVPVLSSDFYHLQTCDGAYVRSELTLLSNYYPYTI